MRKIFRWLITTEEELKKEKRKSYREGEENAKKPKGKRIYGG